MIDAKTAMTLIMDRIVPPDPVYADFRSLGLFAAEDVVCLEPVPPFDNSAMDGYALIFNDVSSASTDAPVTLEVIEDIPAGVVPTRTVVSGKAIRIMTGAMMPAGADTVIMREKTDESDPADVKILESPLRQGVNIRFAGEDLPVGSTVIAKGSRIRPQEVGLLASIGAVKILVRPRPLVGILTTGNEIIEPWEKVEEGGIRSSNSYTLISQVEKAGGKSRYLGIGRDDRDDLKERIEAADGCDFLVTSGGVSMGDYDYLLDVLEGMGMERVFWKVGIKPGKPLLYGILDGMHVFGLPGNPVSTMITFEEFVRPAILKWMGSRFLSRPTVEVTMDEVISKKKGRLNMVRGITRIDENGVFRATTTGPQGSGILRSMGRANSLILVPEDISFVDAGDKLKAHLIDLPEGCLDISTGEEPV